VLRLHPSAIDYTILAIYFVVVLGIGFVARLFIKSDLDFFLSGRSLPAWITGLAFIAANLGALEILGQPPTAPSTESPRCTITGSGRSRRWCSWGCS
jgi:SSS family solute:Na+ symporter